MAKQISKLPDAPSASRPASFNQDADKFVGALPKFVDEANALAAEAESNAQKIGDAKADADRAEAAKNTAASAASQAASYAGAIEVAKNALADASSTLNEMKNIVNNGFIDDSSINENRSYSSKKIEDTFFKKTGGVTVEKLKLKGEVEDGALAANSTVLFSENGSELVRKASVNKLKEVLGSGIQTGSDAVLNTLHLTSNNTCNNLKIGDDVTLGDIDLEAGIGLRGLQPGTKTKGFVKFGEKGPVVGFAGSGTLLCDNRHVDSFAAIDLPVGDYRSWDFWRNIVPGRYWYGNIEGTNAPMPWGFVEVVQFFAEKTITWGLGAIIYHTNINHINAPVEWKKVAMLDDIVFFREPIDRKPDRYPNTTYTNNTGKPIFLQVTAVGDLVMIYVGNQIVARAYGLGSGSTTLSTIVPPGKTYRVNCQTVVFWYE